MLAYLIVLTKVAEGIFGVGSNRQFGVVEKYVYRIFGVGNLF